jgi:MFS family permease
VIFTAEIHSQANIRQGSKGLSAETSGVHLLPYLLSQTLAAVVAGIIINRTGFFNPAMLGGTVIFSIGAGFLTSLSTRTPSPQWIGFQVLAGFGTGCAQFMAMGIAQQLLVKEDESIGLSLVYMIKTLGGYFST